MKKSWLNFEHNIFLDYVAELWALNESDKACYLLGNGVGKNKLLAFLALVKDLKRVRYFKWLFYIRRITTGGL